MRILYYLLRIALFDLSHKTTDSGKTSLIIFFDPSIAFGIVKNNLFFCNGVPMETLRLFFTSDPHESLWVVTPPKKSYTLTPRLMQSLKTCDLKTFPTPYCSHSGSKPSCRRKDIFEYSKQN